MAVIFEEPAPTTSFGSVSKSAIALNRNDIFLIFFAKKSFKDEKKKYITLIYTYIFFYYIKIYSFLNTVYINEC
jgi:hypothetical protein